MLKKTIKPFGVFLLERCCRKNNIGSVLNTRHRLFKRLFVNIPDTVKEATIHLGIVQGINLLVPMLVYGILLKRLGATIFGEVIYAQTLVNFGSIVITYSFNLIGPKLITQNGLETSKTSRIFCLITSAKIIILTFVLLPIFGLAVLGYAFKKTFIIFFISSWSLVYEALNPSWFFQGAELVSKLTFPNLCSKIVQLFLMVSIVQTSADYIFVPVIYLVTSLGLLVHQYWYLIKRCGIRFVCFQKAEILTLYREGFDLFITISMAALYVNSSKALVGHKLGFNELSVYDFGEKVCNLLKMPLGIVAQSFYPSNCKVKSVNEIKRQMHVLIIVTGICALVFGLLALTVLPLFNQDSIRRSGAVILLLSLTIPLNVVSGFGGINYLVVFGRFTILRNAVIASNIAYLVGFLIILKYQLESVNRFAALTLVSETVSAVIIYHYISHDKKNNYRNRVVDGSANNDC